MDERVALIAALLLPIVVGLLAKPARAETARRWLTAYLPIGGSVCPLMLWLSVPLDRKQALAPIMSVCFSIGVTAGLSFWSARSFIKGGGLRR